MTLPCVLFALLFTTTDLSRLPIKTPDKEMSSNKAKIFIDGQAGTTGLDMRDRLLGSPHYQLLEIDPEARKDSTVRRELIEAADVAILCLPDDAAREAVALAQNTNTRILDASTAHRVHDHWAYGLPERSANARRQIGEAQYVSNPGCYPQGVILALAPLISAGWLAADAPLAVHALSGYSGGGNALINRLESLSAEEAPSWAARPYALGLQHKHLPEMQRYCGLDSVPLFAPSVGAYYKGMLVSTALPAGTLCKGKSPADVAQLLQERYENEPLVSVRDIEDAAPDGFLDPTACNDTNQIELFVTGNSAQTMITARYDNLGKGAGGAALQNLNLMSGIPETQGLST